MTEALPSFRSIQRIICSDYKAFPEGCFKFDDLASHIKEHNASTAVTIGEDATRVISRVDYDSETNKCVGFVLPLDNNGLPLVDSFLAVSFKAMEDMFKTAAIAKYAYVYMAQSLCLNAPPFCLACIGSDNKFTAQHVMLRWKHIYDECRKRGMLVLSFGGDGDSRIMSAMKQSVSLMSATKEPLLQTIPSSPLVPRIPATWKEWFCVHPRSTVSYVQDIVHVGVKLKSRLLKPSILLPVGPNFSASGNHLQLVRTAYGKDQHNLRERDINHKDKQNFDSVLHIMHSAHLLGTIPEAKGTFVYVEIMASTVDSYLDKSLSPLERVEKAWYANFFVRYWRQWILLSEKYTLKHNFLTNNAYLCIELNAHALLTFLMNARDNVSKEDIVFLPWLLGSQSCEKTFRSARSMSTVFSSVLNFSILGLLRRLHRLNIQAVLQADAEKSGIRFPRAEKHLERSGMKSYVPPSVTSISNKEIGKAVENALSKAKETLSSLEMDQLLKKHSKWDNVKWSNVSDHDCDVESDADEDSDDDDQVDVESAAKEEVVSAVIQEVCNDDPVEVEKDIQSIRKEGMAKSRVSEKLGKFKKSLAPIKLNSGMPSYAFTDSDMNAGKKFSPYVEVSLNDRTFSIRKITAIWLLQENERVSSDRLFRVREKQPFSSTSQSLIPISCANPVMLATLTVGDLCLFKLTTDWELGCILQFAKYDTDTKKYSKPYKEQNAKVSSKHVGVLCTWYERVKHSMFQLTKNREVEYKPCQSSASRIKHTDTINNSLTCDCTNKYKLRAVFISLQKEYSRIA